MRRPLRRFRALIFAAFAFVAGTGGLGAAVAGDGPAFSTTGRSRSFTSPDRVPDGLARSDWLGIRAAYEAGRHAIEPTATGWQAPNPGQRWTTAFDQRGFLVVPQDAAWQWGLQLMSYGFGEEQHAVGGTPAVQVAGQRLSYQWDGAVEEWFVNDQRGLEHGFIVHQRPEVSPPGSPSQLSFLLATRGTLHPSVGPEAQGVFFQDATGATVLTYTGLKVWDADGRALAARFEAVAPNRVRLVVDEHHARYPITIDPIAQQAYLKASNTQSSDQFGFCVAISGDTVAVASYSEDGNARGVNGNQGNNSAPDAGAVYVFVRSGTTWTQQAYLKASNTEAIDFFGQSLAISGDTIVVGAYGEDSSATGVNGNQNNNNALWSGAAYVFVRNGTTWSQQAYLKASNTAEGDGFGISVGVSGDTVVVGAWNEDSNATGVNGNQSNNNAPNSGAAYVFVRTGTTWSQQAYLKASNTAAGHSFSYPSLAVSADTVVVGALNEESAATGVNGDQWNTNAPHSGAAYVFVRTGTTWSQQAYLKASNPGEGDGFGSSVAVSGDTVVVGAWYEDSSATGVNGNQNSNSAIRSGAAYVFVRTGITWSQQAYLKASNTGEEDAFGGSVALSDNTVVVGARYEDSSATGINGSQNNNSAPDAGAAYVFVRNGSIWTQQAYLKASNTGSGFGYSVAVSGDSVVIGSPAEDSNTTGVNGNQNDSSAPNSGAAYIFTGLGLPRPVITDAALQGGGAFQLRFTGEAGASYLIEGSSADLLDWTPLGAPTEAAPGVFEFIDPNAPNHSSQFYRVR